MKTKWEERQHPVEEGLAHLRTNTPIVACHDVKKGGGGKLRWSLDLTTTRRLEAAFAARKHKKSSERGTHTRR